MKTSKVTIAKRLTKIGGLTAFAVAQLAWHLPAHADQPADPLVVFVQHPTNCAYFLGESGFRGEDLSYVFGQDVVAAMNQIVATNVSVKASLDVIEKACTNKLVNAVNVKIGAQ